MKHRIAALRGLVVQRRADGYVSLDPPVNEYLTGFHGSTSAVVVTPRAAVLLCDFLGRAVIPTTGAMITGPATVQLSHREMISGSLTPLVTYTVSIGPLFQTVLARVP